MGAYGAWDVYINNHKMTDIKIYQDRESLARAAAEHIIESGTTAIQNQDRFSLALAGGSTPKAAYELLASDEYAQRLDWKRVHIFWGDERCVPPEHPDSNYRMARQSLLDHVPIPAKNIYRMRAEEEPIKAALEYEGTLRAFFSMQPDHSNDPDVGSVGQKSYDLVLLGMGDDGHTASLFPSSDALNESVCWVTAVEHTNPPPPLVTRLTLTLPAINAAAQVIFLVAGASKSQSLKYVLSPPDQSSPALPAQLIHPLNGQLLWLVDEAAYSGKSKQYDTI
jgi:6-phosphogluconolactonase